MRKRAVKFGLAVNAALTAAFSIPQETDHVERDFLRLAASNEIGKDKVSFKM